MPGLIFILKRAEMYNLSLWPCLCSMGNIESNHNFTGVCLNGLVISGNNIHMRWTEEHYVSFLGM